MNTRKSALLPSLAMAMAAAGCGREPATSAAAPATELAVQHWMGRWTGPEGTWLEVQRTGTGYSVTIMNLDAARTFPATVTAEAIAFERDGVRETLRTTDGPATGMKWLAAKSDCVTVRAGEGYCRD